MNVIPLFKKQRPVTQYQQFKDMVARVRHLPTFREMLIELFNSGYSDKEICLFAHTLYSPMKTSPHFELSTFIKGLDFTEE